MRVAAYDFLVSRDFKNFRFWSEGPVGKVEKMIVFTKFDYGDPDFYNLGFGDLRSGGCLDDLVTTNNGDTEKVLATVAKSVIIFTDIYSDAFIYVQGSTPSRTRRYQMGINKFLPEIESLFHIYGYNSTIEIEPFRPGKNYIAFGANRKK